MNGKHFLCMAVAGVLTMSAVAGEAERETFRKWHVGIGAAFNAKVGSSLKMRNIPSGGSYSLPLGVNSKATAEENAKNHVYDGGGFIAEDDNHQQYTENWKLPEGNYDEDTGKFTLYNAYQEVVEGENGFSSQDESEDCMHFGVSAEVSRELWIRDELEEHRRGVDFVAAFSYFFARDIYSAKGVGTSFVRDGRFETVVDDPDAMYGVSPSDGMYGNGNQIPTGFSPALDMTKIGQYTDVPGEVNPIAATPYRASGDYQELEMFFMFRPWYEIKDWWRVFAEAGVGVSWGRFDSSFKGGGVSEDETFEQWDVYGVAGIGTAFRYDDWTLGVDFIGRFLRDDFDVDGKYVEGSLNRADWGFRVMLGYEF